MQTILFLHGWGGDSNSFAPLLPHLRASYNVLTPSTPNFAQNDTWPTTPWTLEDYAYYIEHVLDEAGVTKCHIVAHSFGARITTLLATRNPTRYEKLALTGAAGIRRRNPIRFMRIKIYKLLRTLRLKKPGGSSDYLALSLHGRETFKHIINRDLRPFIRRIPHKTLLIYGEHDSATPLKHGKIWARITPNAILKTYPKATHFAHIEHPTRFVNDVLHFLAQD